MSTTQYDVVLETTQEEENFSNLDPMEILMALEEEELDTGYDTYALFTNANNTDGGVL